MTATTSPGAVPVRAPARRVSAAAGPAAGRRLLGWAAILGSVLYLASDLLEAAHGGFFGAQLWMTLVAEATIPFVVIGLYRIQRPAIGAAGKWGAYLYAYSFVFFTGTVVYALVDHTSDFERLSRNLDPAMTVHGVSMVAAAAAFAYGSIRAAVLPRWTGQLLALGVIAVALAAGSPPAVELVAVAVRDVAFVAMGWAVLMGTSNGATHPAFTRLGMILDTIGAIPIWVVTPLLRPWHMRWGATRAERHSAMSGDAVVPRAQFNATRAITIAAPPEDVWPWIVQLGYGRAGFYTYDLVDNGGVQSADRIVEEHQHLAVGDPIPMFHESHGLAIAYKVESRDDESMLWVHRPHDGDAPDSTWCWRLVALADGTTRLVTRMKQDYRWKTPRLALFNLILMEFGDFAMERRMLKGIKSRAERSGQTECGDASPKRVEDMEGLRGFQLKDLAGARSRLIVRRPDTDVACSRGG